MDLTYTPNYPNEDNEANWKGGNATPITPDTLNNIEGGVSLAVYSLKNLIQTIGNGPINFSGQLTEITPIKPIRYVFTSARQEDNLIPYFVVSAENGLEEGYDTLKFNAELSNYHNNIFYSDQKVSFELRIIGKIKDGEAKPSNYSCYAPSGEKGYGEREHSLNLQLKYGDSVFQKTATKNLSYDSYSGGGNFRQTDGGTDKKNVFIQDLNIKEDGTFSITNNLALALYHNTIHIPNIFSILKTNKINNIDISKIQISKDSTEQILAGSSKITFGYRNSDKKYIYLEPDKIEYLYLEILPIFYKDALYYNSEQEFLGMESEGE